MSFGLILATIMLSNDYSGVPIAIVSREEVRDGRLYDVLLAPSCEGNVPICEPWERNWTDGLRLLPGDTVTPEGLILREKPDA